MPQELEINSIVEGIVVRLKPFGAIIKLPENHQGLVHISHVSNKFVQDISEHLTVGDVVKVKILSIDSASGRFSLSIKETEEPQKNQFKPQYPQSRTYEENSPATPEEKFEDKFKEWLKSSNERLAGLNKRNKRR